MAALTPADLGIGQLFWALREAVVVAEAESGAIVLWNPAAERVFGYPAEEAVGLLVEALIPEPLRARHRAGLARFAATGHGALVDGGEPVELPALRKDGSPLTIDLSLSPIAAGPTGGRYALAVIRDVTERKRAEELQVQYVRAQAAQREAEAALEQRDALLAAVTHDLLNPLAALLGQAQLLRRRATRLAGPEAEPLVVGLDRLRATGERLARLVEGLRDVAQVRAGAPVELTRGPLDLAELAERIAQEHRLAAPGRAIRVGRPEAALVGNWDGPRLERVLDNLLANAVKYSPEGAPIDVRVGREDAAEGAWAVLAVEDRGLGIPAADLPHVFERHRRGGNVGAVEGSGVGLATVCHLAEQHGGRVEVRSREGEGSTFTVRLPL